MFCPQCKTEYRPGFDRCADCGIGLVAELPVDAPPAYIEYEHVFSTFDWGDIAFIKSVLDGEKITYYFQGEHFNNIGPLIEPVRLMVNRQEADMVREILRDLKLISSQKV